MKKRTCSILLIMVFLAINVNAQKTSLSPKLESYGMVKDPRTTKILVNGSGEVFYTNTFTKNLNRIDGETDQDLGPIIGLEGNNRFEGVFLYRYEMLNGAPYALVVKNTKETGELLLVPMNLDKPAFELEKGIKLLSSASIIKVLARISVVFSTNKQHAVISFLHYSEKKIYYSVLDVKNLKVKFQKEQLLSP